MSTHHRKVMCTLMLMMLFVYESCSINSTVASVAYTLASADLTLALALALLVSKESG